MRNTSTWPPSAPSPTIWPREGWQWLLTLVALVGAVAILFFVQFGYVAIAILTHALSLKELQTAAIPPDQVLILQFLTWAPIGAFILAILPGLSHVSWSTLGFRKPAGRELYIAAIAAVLMTIVVNGAGAAIAAVTHRHDTEQAVALLGQMKTSWQRLSFAFLACVFAPVCEELAFRAFLFNAITRYTNVAVAAILSGIAFGALHATNGSELITVAPALALGGIILAYVYAETRCFWANVTTHAIFNSISVLGFFLAGAK